ncbi:MAG: hypothetical protein ACT4O9_09525 [Blastocatellia bacterium]
MPVHIYFIVILTICLAASAAIAGVTKRVNSLRLGDTEVLVNVYENPNAEITFVAPHHNERTAIIAVKEFVAMNGGRLIEIESLDAGGIPHRFIRFSKDGNRFSIDPNRIFTENGRHCSVPDAVRETVSEFAENLLRIVFKGEGRTLPLGEAFIVAVHNNTDVDSKPASVQHKDLTAHAFIRSSGPNSHGIFYPQASGVFLSNEDRDQDNFIFLSTSKYLGYFSDFGFNVVVQKKAEQLVSKACSVDDGSMSVFAAQNSIEYICLEADAATGAARQRKMLGAVFALLKK